MRIESKFLMKASIYILKKYSLELFSFNIIF